MPPYNWEFTKEEKVTSNRFNIVQKFCRSYLCASWAKSSSNSSSSWFTFTSGRTDVSVSLVPVSAIPFTISSCRRSARWRVSFSANPWIKSCSSLEVHYSHCFLLHKQNRLGLGYLIILEKYSYVVSFTRSVTRFWYERHWSTRSTITSCFTPCMFCSEY